MTTSSNSSESFDSLVSDAENTKQTYLNKKSFFNYNFFLLTATAIPLLATGFFNWLIDPQDVFNTPNYLGINHEKPKKDTNDRLFKAVDIIRLQPNVIVMGSSRTKQGINPEHILIKQQGNAYNLAINGPNFYEVKRYIQHAIYNQPDIKQIILGIDFFMFNQTLANQPSFAEARLEKKYIIPSDLVTVLFSVNALDNSLKTVKASQLSLAKDNNYGENGFMPNRNLDNGETIWRFEQSIQLYFRLHSDYQFSQKYWSDFKEIVNLCRQKGIDLKVFISPSHATHWQSIAATGKWDIFEDWKRKLVDLVEVWDFSGYNSITSEAIAKYMNNYVDNSHYTPAIGELIVQRIFNQSTNNIPNDFGVLLTKENIEKHLAKIRQDNIIWQKNHPEELALVNKLKAIKTNQ